VLLASSFGEFTKASLVEESGPESCLPGS